MLYVKIFGRNQDEYDFAKFSEQIKKKSRRHALRTVLSSGGVHGNKPVYSFDSHRSPSLLRLFII